MPPCRSLPDARAGLHAERAAIEIEQRFLLLNRLGLLAAQPDELAHHLDIEACRLRFHVDIANIRAERLALLLKPLDSLDQAAQPVGRNAAGAGTRSQGGSAR